MKLLITIDAECDNAWAKSREVLTKNARFLPRFQSLCDKYHYKPTYLVAHEMAKDDFFVDFAKDALSRNACEVGLHPHVWFTPPIYNLTSDDMLFQPYMIEYPENIIRQKVKFLTDLLEDTFGTKMLSHRSGRWSLNAVYAKILVEFGYKVDCSVTPHHKWDAVARPSGEPPCPDIDYRNFPAEAYFLDSEDVSKPGNLPILEIPVSIIPNYGRVLNAAYSILPEKFCRRGIRYIFGRQVKWLRPHPVYKEMMKVVKTKLSEKSDYIMFMTHSSELMPAGSPNFINSGDIEKLYDQVEEVFQYLTENDVEAATCYEYYQYFTSKVNTQT